MRPLKRLERHSTVRFERSRLRQFDRVVTVSERDASALTMLDPAIKSAVIPNGVDAEYFTPGPGAHEQRLIVFVGTMSWTPNVQAVSLYDTTRAPAGAKSASRTPDSLSWDEAPPARSRRSGSSGPESPWSGRSRMSDLGFAARTSPYARW